MKTLFSFLIPLVVCAGLVSAVNFASAGDDTPSVATAPKLAEHPYRDTLIASADTAQPDAGVASAPSADTATQPAPTASPLDELADLKAKYAALKAATPDVKLLAYAALIAAALKLLLTLFNRYVYKETKRWTKWVALGAAVPIALLSYFALGHSLFESLIFAGAGPGAIIVHELLQPKKTEPAAA